ncbi:uncharacterized protein LOC144004583 [Festucalex cinctus]
MAMRPVRPHSETYPSVCCSVSPSVSYSSLTDGPADDGDAHTPIFSVSKSSMDVFKHDPAWTGADLRRSSSANAEQGPPRQLHGWRRVGSLQSPDAHNPPALGERWVANMRRWSRCSGGGSRSSTPDTVVWGGGTSRPGSLARDGSCCAAPSSPTALTSSPFISPLLTPTLTPGDLCASSPASATTLLPKQGDSPDVCSESTAPLNQQRDSPGLCFESTTPFSHQGDSPGVCFESTTSFSQQGDSPDVCSESTAPLNQQRDSPGFCFESTAPFSQQGDSPGVCSESTAPFSQQGDSPELCSESTAPFHQQGDSPGSSLASATLPPEPLFHPTGRDDDTFPGNRLLYFQYPSPMASSVCSEEGALPFHGCLPGEETPPTSDPRACSENETQEPDERASACRLQLPWQAQPRRSPLASSLSDSHLREGCRCSRGGARRREMVDAAVQTLSASRLLLGSPPGSRLDLKASNSDLASPSSSLISPSADEEEEEEKPKVVQERRRSCLKAEQDEPGGRRRSSMKQVQWDEDGMTWDVHGASMEPEVLTAAIRKHLELHNSPQTVKRPSKKKTKAPKPPAPPSAPPPEETPPEVTQDKGGETEEAPHEASRTQEGAAANDDVPKSPSLSRGIIRKRSVMRSLRPGWCGGSKNEDD